MNQTDLLKLEKAGDFRLYGKMPKVAADMDVAEGFANADILDDEGNVQRRKTWREYIYIMAENETHVLGKLVEQNADTSFTKTLEEPERSIAISIVGMRNIYSHAGALAQRELMCPSEEV